MRASIQRLRAEIASDRRALARHGEELQHLGLGSHATPGDSARAAVARHHFYGAVESILSRVCRELEGALPTGPDGH